MEDNHDHDHDRETVIGGGVFFMGVLMVALGVALARLGEALFLAIWNGALKL